MMHFCLQAEVSGGGIIMVYMALVYLNYGACIMFVVIFHPRLLVELTKLFILPIAEVWLSLRFGYHYYNQQSDKCQR